MYKEKTCKCKYSQPATKCSENGITSYCTKCEKDTKITTMKVLALDIATKKQDGVLKRLTALDLKPNRGRAKE
jgi:hypothetical protein